MSKLKIVAAIIFVFVFLSCRDVIGPVEGNSPEGSYVVWFNGLSGYADVYFIEADSLITNAWTTGQASNHILQTGANQFAVLASLSADLRLFSGENTGETIGTIVFPEGSNPWSFVVHEEIGYATLPTKNSVSVFDLATLQITGSITTDINPTGIEYFNNMVFVGYGSWPEPESTGGVSVFETSTGELLKWIDTGLNTHWLKLQPSGLLHCYSTTYPDMNGRITIVNPVSLNIEAVIECDGAPGQAILVGNEYVSPDGWGAGGLIKYSETGQFTRLDLPFSPTELTLHENTIYATSFSSNKVFMLDSQSFVIMDSISSGGEGPQGIIAITL